MWVEPNHRRGKIYVYIKMVTSMSLALVYYGFRWEVIKKALEYKYKVKLENSLLLERKFYNLPQSVLIKFKSLFGDEK